MTKIIPFSLDQEVAAAVKEIPKGKRSREINEILKRELLGESNQMIEIKEMLESIITESESNVDFKNDEEVSQALGSIIGRRKQKNE